MRKEAETTTQPHPPSGGWDLSSEDVIELFSPSCFSSLMFFSVLFATVQND